jgi:8-oxo-dGTP pyrophosphatase MutT (NUDIX family)
MELNTFLTKISKIKRQELRGLNVQLEMAPKERLNFDFESIQSNHPKDAAVLALFYPNHQQEMCFLLTLRATYKGTHSAQISFPGGKKDQLDANLMQTALREAHEEIGVAIDENQIIKTFTKTYIPPSNFYVTPFMGFLNKRPDFVTNYEVEQVIDVKLSHLLNDSNMISETLSTSYMTDIEVPCFKFENHIVWGATAMILNEIKHLFKDIDKL